MILRSARESAKRLKTMETTKKILGASWAVALILSTFVVIGTFTGVDVTNLTDLTKTAWAEVAVTHAFYLWKAKCENIAKGVQKLVKQLAEQYGIEAAARLAEIIYKD